MNLGIQYLLLAYAITTSTAAFLTSTVASHRPTASGNLHLLAAVSRDNIIHDRAGIQHVFQSRKNFLACSLSASTAFLSTMIQPPTPANAAYGDSSNLELPNYIEFLIEKNSSVDPSKILYKGADSEVQLKRISEAARRLAEIPEIAKQKKWSQVQGILTGPLGTLIQTMNSLCKYSDSAEAKKASGKVKTDIIAISQAASKRSEMDVLKACEDAQKDLEAFAKLVF